MGCLENLTSYSLGESIVISASGEDVWNSLLDYQSELYQCISTLILVQGFDSNGRRKKDGELAKVRDLLRVTRKIGCFGAFDVDWIVTSITGNTMEYPRAVSMAFDNVLGCISTMTWTLDLISGDEESCILTASYCCLPLHWKYIFHAFMHSNSCKDFFRNGLHDIVNYFRRENAIEADQGEGHSAAKTMNERNSTASGFTAATTSNESKNSSCTSSSSVSVDSSLAAD
jgi:hypothetical protein